MDGLRKMVSILDDGREADFDEGRVSRLVSTGPANLWRLWNLRPAEIEEKETALAEFHEMMDAAGAGMDQGAFDDAFHHFEIIRNISAFDVTRTSALLEIGHQQTEEALSQLETLMQPPPCVFHSYALEAFQDFVPLFILLIINHSQPVPQARPSPLSQPETSIVRP